jgi:HAD superfamily hydrolase (TIGR01509 family)
MVHRPAPIRIILWPPQGRTCVLIPLQEGDFNAIIFDCDGTLVDTAQAHFKAYNDALAEAGIELDLDWYQSRAGLTPASLVEEYETKFSRRIPYTLPELMKKYSRAFQGNMSQIRENGIVANVARRWKSVVPMAVASNGERENVRASLRACRLLELFDTIVTTEDGNPGKPAPDLFLEAASQLHVSPNRCLVFEDSDQGLTAAKAAGMKSIDVRMLSQPDQGLRILRSLCL